MADRPLLILPRSVPAAKARRQGRGSGPKPLSPARQGQRLGPKINELETAFEAKRVRLQATAAGVEPEDVLVLETAGTVEDFFKAVAQIEGLEFLGEFDKDDIPPDDDFFVEDKSGAVKEYRGRVYMVFSNQEAFRRLLALWGRWQAGENLTGKNLAKLRNVFSLLRDIRRWSTKDRLEETGVLDDWQDRIAHGSEVLPCEIEIWFRRDAARRADAAARVSQQVRDLGGEVTAQAVIEEIRYHAVAARLPHAAVEQFLDEHTRGDIALVQCEQVQFFRAAGQMAGRVPADSKEPTALDFDGALPAPGTEPVIALLDGLPLQAHRALAGRLSVEDPDDYGSDYQAHARLHGTSMASMIIWGDLGSSQPSPIPQPLYVRPILRPVYPPAGWEGLEPEEQVPEGVLVVDLIHRAVRRLFDGEGDQSPTAPMVAVVNLSIGIRDRLFDGTMSPLARLLDWLAWHYGVLFVVSAGNHLHAIETGIPWSVLVDLDESELTNHLIKSIAKDSRHRRLLSPAEAMNVVTVGATHQDDDNAALPPSRIDPVPMGHPSVLNAQGLGYKRSIKPEVLVPGGRVQLLRPLLDGETALKLLRTAASPGQTVATPGPSPGDLTHVTKSRGTSNGTALASRAAAFLQPVVQELREQEGGTLLDGVSDGLLLKVLLVHGARWGAAGAHFRELLRTDENSRKLAEYLTRMLGFGAADFDVVRACTATRVTALAAGVIERDAGFVHRFPLPPSLSGKRGERRLTVTLAWMTPVSPLNHRWRTAQLWFTSPTSKLKIGSNKHLERADADWQAAQRGTVQHEVFGGEKAAAFVDGDDVVIHVSCREDAPVLTGAIPYALAVTLEVAEEIGIDIYAEVRERVRNRLRVAAGGGESA